MGQKISCLYLVLYDYLTRVRKVRVYFFPFCLYRSIFFWFSTTLYVGNSNILKGNITVPGWLTESRKYVAVLCQFVLILSDFPPFAYFLVNYLISLPKVHIMLGKKTVTHRLVQSGTRDEKKTCLCFKSSQSCKWKCKEQRKCYTQLTNNFFSILFDDDIPFDHPDWFLLGILAVCFFCPSVYVIISQIFFSNTC